MESLHIYRVVTLGCLFLGYTHHMRSMIGRSSLREYVITNHTPRENKTPFLHSVRAYRFRTHTHKARESKPSPLELHI